MTPEEITRLERALTELREERARDWQSFRDHEFKPFVERNGNDHASILKQTKETNHRVSSLELWRARFEGAFLLGRVAWAVLGVGLAILGMLIKIQWG